jgi:hypothetical protein
MTATPLATEMPGATGLEVTRLRLGAQAIGGRGWEHGWGPQGDVESIAAIRHALDQAINWIERPDHDPILSAAELTDQDAAELEGGAR